MDQTSRQAISGCRGIRQQPLVATGPAVNQEYYRDAMSRLRKNIKKKSSKWWKDIVTSGCVGSGKVFRRWRMFEGDYFWEKNFGIDKITSVRRDPIARDNLPVVVAALFLHVSVVRVCHVSVTIYGSSTAPSSTLFMCTLFKFPNSLKMKCSVFFLNALIESYQPNEHCHNWIFTYDMTVF